jgi:peptide/nickel transport system substrate-binding protein
MEEASMKRFMIFVTVIVIGSVLAACAAAEPEVVEVEKEVTRIVTEKIVETVIVEGTPQVVEREVTVETVVTATPAPEEPRTLVVGLDLSSAYSLDPHANFETLGVLVGYQCYDNLVRMTPDNWFEPAPALAESWEWADDGLSITFHLRSDVTFASGNPLTAEDVRFTWLRHKNLHGDSSGLIAMIKDVIVVDDLTVTVTFDDPTPDFLMIASTAFEGIMDSQLVKEHGGVETPDAADVDQATEWLDQNSAGSGPFVLKSWVSESEAVLEANPNYWRGKPYFDRIVFRHTPDKVAGFQQVQKGDLDILFSPNLDQVEQAETDPNVRVVLPAALNILYMNLTCDPEMSEPLSDARVRQAISLALDRDGMLEAVLSGYGNTIPSVIPVGIPGVDPDKVPERDLEKARALLAEAGYEDGFSETLSHGTTSQYSVMAAKIQSDLAEIGITVNLNPMDTSELISHAWGDHDLPWYIGRWIPDYVGYTIWTDWWGTDDLVPGTVRCQVPQELADITSVIAHEFDQEKRLEAVEEWQDMMMDVSYGLGMLQYYEAFFVHADLKGFEYVPGTYTDMWSMYKELPGR